jgi:hypothetical protein
MMVQRSKYQLEMCLRDALRPLGEGWNLDVIEAIADQYHVKFSDRSESSISEIECALRELLGSSANLFIDRFYAELERAGHKL